MASDDAWEQKEKISGCVEMGIRSGEKGGERGERERGGVGARKVVIRRINRANI